MQKDFQRRIFAFQAILSTGSPLKPNSYEYVYRDIKVRNHGILNYTQTIRFKINYYTYVCLLLDFILDKCLVGINLWWY